MDRFPGAIDSFSDGGLPVLIATVHRFRRDLDIKTR
jgi:hypothetical protein